MEKVAVISSVYGDYDAPVDLPVQDRPYEAILVTDHHHDGLTGWQQVIEPRHHLHPRMAAKVAKCRPDIYTDATITIWIDASFAILRSDFVSWCVQQIGVYPIGQIRHPDRQHIMAEAHVSAQMTKYQGQAVKEQAAEYLRRGYPDGWGLWATGLIVRRNTSQTREFGGMWLMEQLLWTYQDQISEPPMLHLAGLKPIELATELRSSEFFTIRAHASEA